MTTGAQSVLHVFNELKFSGAEMLLSSAHNEFNEFGTNTILATGDEVGAYAPVLAQCGYRIQHLPFRKNLKFFWDFHRLLKQLRPSIVHIHSERAAFWYGLVARLHGRGCVRTIHNDFQFEGNLAKRRALERRILKQAGVAHVACSARVAQNERARFGLETVVINNWIDPRRAQPVTLELRAKARAQLAIPENEMVVVSIANYGPAKNHEALVTAVRSCKDTVPVRYFFCGDGGDRLATKMSVAPSEPIHFEGAVADIAPYLHAADAFISTSFFEGGPIALIEAAYAGIPCITTDVGIAAEMKTFPAVTFIEPTPESAYSAIVALYKKPLNSRLSEGAMLSASVGERFTPRKGGRAYTTLYASLQPTHQDPT